jgi:thiamine-monophosphate kinase
MDEFEIIRRLFTPEKNSDSVIVGVGDDGAILRPDAGRDLVTVVDTMVSGVHFPEDLNAADIGFRAVAVNVSDIAAMGGRPRWMTLALTLDNADHDWLEELSSGIASAASAFGVELVGGDITRGSEFVISVQITGDVEPGLVMTRRGASPGDSIYVSGSPGDAALGLSLIQSGDTQLAGSEYLIGRFKRPDARLQLGQAIAPVASAAIDLSDGLYADLGKLLAASGVAGVIELNDIPLSDALLRTVDRTDALRYALGGGDDYELCITASGDSVIGIGEHFKTPVTKIGRVLEGQGLSCTLGGEAYDYRDDGYRHFD